MTYRSYAKINLYLGVLNRRRDGFHNIETIFQTVSLFDELVVEPVREGIVLECSNPALPCDSGNLVYRAAEMMREEHGVTSGVRLLLRKSIPLAAGMAGGSGNAAATLIALNEVWDLQLPLARLRTMALALGSDVPYCLHGGTMAATRRGEELAVLDPLPETWIVLVHPRLEVSAGSVYSSPLLRRSAEPPFAGRTRSFRRVLRALHAGDIPGAVHNAMEAAVFSRHPELSDLKGRLLTLGCAAAAMSGSGPTVFGLARSKSHAEEVAGHLSERNASIVCPVPQGVRRIDD